MKFVLNGCDISFIAEAPEDITLKQLIKQCDKIIPDWCACGICSLDYAGCNENDENIEPEIIIGYDSIKKANEHVPCSIEGRVMIDIGRVTRYDDCEYGNVCQYQNKE